MKKQRGKGGRGKGVERKESVYPKGYSEFQRVPYKFSPFGGVCVDMSVRVHALTTE